MRFYLHFWKRLFSQLDLWLRGAYIYTLSIAMRGYNYLNSTLKSTNRVYLCVMNLKVASYRLCQIESQYSFFLQLLKARNRVFPVESNKLKCFQGILTFLFEKMIKNNNCTIIFSRVLHKLFHFSTLSSSMYIRTRLVEQMVIVQVRKGDN